MKARTTLLAGAGFIFAAVPAAAEFSMTILHTNDFHARFEPINRFDSTCSAEDNAAGECFGGIARLATAIPAAREGAVNPILLDGGDMFQGTLIHTYYKGEATAEFMNQLGYEAMVVGNHEFNHGPEVLGDFVGSVNFPVLLSNADVSNEPALDRKVQPFWLHVFPSGEAVGLIGLTPADNADLSSPGENITFSSAIEGARKEVERLKAGGIDKIIVLSHSGYRIDLELAAAVPDIDVIIGGHSHTLFSNTDDSAASAYPTMVGTTAIVQAYAHGKYLGVLNVTFDDAGVVTSAEGAPMLLDASVAEDPDTVARLTELAAPLEEIRNRVVAEAAAPIEGDRSVCRVEECEMGNLVTDAMLDRVKDQGIRIAIQNGGGLRASIDAGEVTMGEVLTVLPFQNTLSTFEVTGEQLLAALENGVSQVEDGAGRFPQVAGMQFTWDAAAEPGSRIVEVMVEVDGGLEPLDPAATYGVVSNNYVRGGGDGYEMFEEAANAYDFGPDLADVTAQFLAANGPYTPYISGRISRK
ncbi:MAG: 5'-nucleotidase C-terminal domain-containing protein [Pseudomonadota bacterium]